jgi:quinol monooxygenase YgiN
VRLAAIDHPLEVFAVSQTISFNVQLSVREDRLDDARDLMGDMVASTQEEPGALIYEWFLSADGTTCHTNERYADSAAVLIHFGNYDSKFAERFGACFELSRFSVYGEPSAEARATLVRHGATCLGWLGGFSR